MLLQCRSRVQSVAPVSLQCRSDANFRSKRHLVAYAASGILSLTNVATQNLALILGSLLIPETTASEQVLHERKANSSLGFWTFLLMVFVAGWFSHWTWLRGYAFLASYFAAAPAATLHTKIPTTPSPITSTTSTSVQASMNRPEVFVASQGMRYHTLRNCGGLSTSRTVSRRTPCLLCCSGNEASSQVDGHVAGERNPLHSE